MVDSINVNSLIKNGKTNAYSGVKHPDNTKNTPSANKNSVSIFDSKIVKNAIDAGVGSSAADGIAKLNTDANTDAKTSKIKEGQSSPVNKDKDVENFKKLDKDGDLKVSDKEFIDDLVNKYVKNGKQIPGEYKNFAEYLDAEYQRFKNYAGEDSSMNIDEFKELVRSRIYGMPQKTSVESKISTP